MAYYVVPGVYANEIDLSRYVPNQSATMVGAVITASKGPMNEKTFISTYDQFQRVFGPAMEIHPGTLSLRDFLKNGGNQLWVVRVGDGTEAKATAVVDLINGGELDVDSLDEGTHYNSMKLGVTHTGQKNTTYSSAQSLTNGAMNFTKTIPNVPIVKGTVTIKDGTTVMGRDDGAGAIVFEDDYDEFIATVNYKTGAIAFSGTWAGGSVSKTLNFTATYYSTFNLQLVFTAKDSNDKVITKSVLEVFSDLTISKLKAALDTSKYMRIAANPASVPDAGDYLFEDGSDGVEDLVEAHYIGDTIGSPTGLQIFGYADQVDVNVLCIPGVSTLSVRQSLLEMVSTKRRDSVVILDPPSNINVQTVVDWANGDGTYSAYDTVDNSRCAIYYPHFISYNEVFAEEDLTPPSAAALAALAASELAQAPAGPNRGKVRNIRGIQVEVSDGDRALLAQNRINPISDLMNTGIQVAGQRTGMLGNSALDRLAARMTVNHVQKEITKALVPLMFEPATPRTWRQAELIIQPFLNSLVAQDKLYYALFLCNKSTNPDDVVTNNQMGCACLLKPLKYAEAIIVNFIILDYGAKVEEVLTQLSLAA